MKPPNFLIVLGDALRASDWPGGSDPVPGMRFAEQIQRESVVFPRAASVAPWTIPAHASLFTGLYPWEHGAHGKGDLRLAASVPRLPAMLEKLGYRSLCLSANTLICPRFGLVDGFNDSGWGGWWESYFRRVRTDSPPSTPEEEKAEAARLDRLREGPLGQLILRNTERFYRYPYLFDALDRMHQKIRYPGQRRDLSVAPWLEPSLGAWLRAQPADKPVMAFLNLCDTHEPYYAPPGSTSGLGEWWASAKVRQDFVSALSGEWHPEPSELKVLREMYRATVLNLDHRLESFVQAFKDVGRWEDTVLVVTADHGQAFGEHGQLFHLNGVIDPMLRIPLWYRPRDGSGGGKRAEGWAGLHDIAPTFLQDAGDENTRFPSSVPLQSLIDRPRPQALVAMSDGLVWKHLRRVIPSDRQGEFDKVTVVGYDGTEKMIFDTSNGRTELFDIESDPGELTNLWSPSENGMTSTLTELQRIGRKLNDLPEVELAPDVEERLRAWGYI